MLRETSYGGADSTFAIRGNELIIEELKSRREAAREYLLEHADDRQIIYTGPCGQPMDIGSVCVMLLRELRESQRIPSQQAVTDIPAQDPVTQQNEGE